MATVVDALIVSLGLDPSDFIQKSEAARADLAKTGDAGRRAASETEGNVKRATDAAGKNAQQLDAWGKGAAESIGKLRDTFLGLVAAFTLGKGIETFTVDTTQAEAAAGRVAHNLNIPVKTLSEWQQVMNTVGGTADDANSSLGGLQKTMMSANMGDIGAAHTLSILGIKGNEDPSTALIKASQFFSSHSGALDQQIAGQAGITTAMLNFLETGPTQVQASLNAEAPTAITQHQVDDATALQKEWGQLENTLDAVGREILDDVNPMLQAFLGWLQKMADWALKHPEMAGAGVAAGAALTGAAGAATLKKLAGWLLGRGGASAPEEAEEASAAADVAAAGGSAVLSPALMAALGVYASNRLGEPGIDPNEEAELRTLYPDAPHGTPAAVTADRTLPAPAQTLLNTIASGESGGDYAREYGSLPDMTSFSDHPDVETQLPDGTTTSAAGRYQFEVDTWRRLQKQLGLTDFSPKSQDQAAWQLAQDTYRSQSGRDLLADLQQRNPQVDAAIQKSLEGQWPSLARLSGAAFAQALGMPLTPPPAATPLSGPINELKRLTGQSSPPAAPPPAAHEAALPQGVIDLLNQIRAQPSPSQQAVQMMASHVAALAAAPHIRHTHNHHAPVTTNNNQSAETHVHSVVVNTQAKNADGIARGIGDALKKNGLIAMGMNRGLA